jgi:hypothetical protein
MAAAKADGSEAAERPQLVIIVAPVPGSAGHFRAQLEGTDEVLVASSRQPFVDSARALVAKGFDPNATLIMRHSGSNVVALKARLAVAAKLGVEEGPRGPRFVPHRTGPKTHVAASPVAKERERPPALPGVGPRLKKDDLPAAQVHRAGPHRGGLRAAGGEAES